MNILITGAAGLLGNHLSRYLHANGYNVVGIDNFSGGYEEFCDSKIHIENLDLVEHSGHINYIFWKHKIDVVYHFAAYAALGLSPFIRNYNYQNNVIASANLINAAINYDAKKFIFASSMDVYGNQTPPFTEDMIPQPEDPYGIAKYAVEMDLKSAYEQFGLNYTIVRPHNVIGIYQNIWDKYRNVIGIWIRRILAGEPMLIYGDGTVRRAFSDIKYYLEPFEKLMSKGNGEIINIGADKDYTLLEVANILKEIATKYGYNPTIEHREPRKEVKIAYCDHSKAVKLLDFVDNTDIYSLIEEMFVWAKDIEPKEVKHFDYEIEKNIYSYWK